MCVRNVLLEGVVIAWVSCVGGGSVCGECASSGGVVIAWIVGGGEGGGEFNDDRACASSRGGKSPNVLAGHTRALAVS